VLKLQTKRKLPTYKFFKELGKAHNYLDPIKKGERFSVCEEFAGKVSEGLGVETLTLFTGKKATTKKARKNTRVAKKEFIKATAKNGKVTISKEEYEDFKAFQRFQKSCIQQGYDLAIKNLTAHKEELN
jgi:hypothetical protein